MKVKSPRKDKVYEGKIMAFPEVENELDSFLALVEEGSFPESLDQIAIKCKTHFEYLCQERKCKNGMRFLNLYLCFLMK